MIGRLAQKISGRLFDALVLVPLTTAHRLAGEGVWDRLDPATGTLSRVAGRVVGPLVKGQSAHRLSRAMEFIDRVEAAVGVYGTWEHVDERTVLRKVPSCPFAKRLSRSSSFCTRLGTTMGKEALKSAFPEEGIEFEILSTISQGHPCCTYKLWV